MCLKNEKSRLAGLKINQCGKKPRGLLCSLLSLSSYCLLRTSESIPNKPILCKLQLRLLPCPPSLRVSVPRTVAIQACHKKSPQNSGGSFHEQILNQRSQVQHSQNIFPNKQFLHHEVSLFCFDPTSKIINCMTVIGVKTIIRIVASRA